MKKGVYDDMLVVECDNPFTRFHLPPLALQFIVENAVKHVMDPYSGPLRILIQTRHTDDGTGIVLEDNGVGFDPEGESNPHTTLKNIQQRTAMMCHGAMTILLGKEG